LRLRLWISVYRGLPYVTQSRPFGYSVNGSIKVTLISRVYSMKGSRVIHTNSRLLKLDLYLKTFNGSHFIRYLTTKTNAMTFDWESISVIQDVIVTIKLPGHQFIAGVSKQMTQLTMLTVDCRCNLGSNDCIVTWARVSIKDSIKVLSGE